jgi:hypothetical protein
MDKIQIKETLLTQAIQKGQKSPFFEVSHFSAQSWHVDVLDSL